MKNFSYIMGVRITNENKVNESWGIRIDADNFKDAVLNISKKFTDGCNAKCNAELDIYLRQEKGGFKYYQAKIVEGKISELVDCTQPKCISPSVHVKI